MNKHIKLFGLLASFTIVLWSCVKQDFDVPPINGLSDLEANTTIAQIKALHRNGSIEEISEDLIISGIVVSDDAAGNFYKQLIIQDETGGIEIRIDVTNLNVDYPRGRRVFVKCNGLAITDYNNFIQLSYNGERIPSSFVEQYIEKGKLETQLSPKPILISNLSLDDVGTLIQLNEVEVSKADNGTTYADPNVSVNKTIEDCIGNSIIMRNSGFASFQAKTMPEGNGTLIGVLSIFRDDYQILIRDEADLDMPNDPCNRSSGNADLITIQELKDLFESGSTSAPDNKKIEATVISDLDNGNITNKNMVVQDASAGITVRFTAAHNFKLNEIVSLDVSGMTLDEFNGLLQLNNIPLGNASQIGIGNITPNEKTIGEILADFNTFESTLVRLKKVSFSGGTKFSDFDIKVSDATGDLELYTGSFASFYNDNIPTNEFEMVGIIGQGGTDQTMQISIRNLDDIIGGNNGGGGGNNDPQDEFTEDFSSFGTNQDVDNNGWTSIAVKGTRVWRGAEFSGNKYAQATAFNDTSPEMETMMFTPPLKLDKAKIISFQSAAGFPNHDGLTVWISTDFDGTNYGAATWTELSGNFANKDTEEHLFIDSGDIDLSAYSGIGYIGFKYVGNGGGNTTSYRIDNVVFGDK